MDKIKLTASEIRKEFIEFFVEHKHTFVPSASLVPGGDSTLLFTNAGMVQFKDVFLGTDKRPYTRAVDSQKCMRVAGKHNDLEDVGQDDYHHTFFEMLGNWSFGDYYKKEAITWAWQLLTEVWKLPKDDLYATCFKDDQGNIPADEEAAEVWKIQPGMNPDHILFFGRKENFWEMAETGPCGPCSEIHIDRGEEFDNLRGKPHHCGVNGECTRYLELWNNVFIQYNRINQDTLEPLPAKHVDTGMGFERIVAVLQGVNSDYKIDLFQRALEVVREVAGTSNDEMYANFTPYRVVVDHARAAAFLIADGVVPGNVGRNYVCRMIIRRAARFGTKLGLRDPFLANVADAFIQEYGDFYPEVIKSRDTILDNITREEIRFARTVESGTAYLQGMLDELKLSGRKSLVGEKAFDLYATYGLPFEIARDIAKEQGLEVDENGFRNAMEEHRVASGGGKAMGKQGGEDAGFYSELLKKLKKVGQIGLDGVEYNPYDWKQTQGPVLALVNEGKLLDEVGTGDKVEVLIPKTGFYLESGGQISDTGTIQAEDKSWEIEVSNLRKPAAGVLVHVGEVIFGHPKVGDLMVATIDGDRRHDIQRNHTATHLLHAALRQVLGENARQAGSYVSPERLRFDFNHPAAMTIEQIQRVEKIVNDAISADYPVISTVKSREQAISEGAMALFGEKYGDSVRAILIGDHYSYELCGGTHLDRTADVGIFLILSESSVAAGVRRIEAITGRAAYVLISKRFKILQESSSILKSSLDEIPQKINSLVQEQSDLRKEINTLQQKIALTDMGEALENPKIINGVRVITHLVYGAKKELLSSLADEFREKYPDKGILVIGSQFEDQVIGMVAVTKDLNKHGINAGEIVNYFSQQLGAKGGGAPHLAFGGGKNPENINEAMENVARRIKDITKG